MNDKVYSSNDEVILTSPEGTPFRFRIIIKENETDNKLARSFEIQRLNTVNEPDKICHYRLADKGHDSFLGFYQKLATDFGLRLPQNRQPVIKSGVKVNYREVLLENLVPEIRYGYGDPAVISVEDRVLKNGTWFYLLVTSNDAPDSFPILRSQNLQNWEFVSFVFPRNKKPLWAADGEFISDFWAPEMHKIGNEFRVYFAARHRDSHELCIGVARSQFPEGPFSADEEPVLKGNAIDPHIFIDHIGIPFMYWKQDNNGVWPSHLVDLLYKHPAIIPQLFVSREDQVTASFIQTLWPWARLLEPMELFLVQQLLIEAVISMFSTFKGCLENLINNYPGEIQDVIRSVLQFMKTPIYAQELSATGSQLVGERVKIIENDQPWEAHLVEGMWVTRQGNQYYLFYTGNDFSTSQYGIGVAIADSHLGPYRKLPKQFLQSTEEWWAPGHPSVVMGPDGKPQLFLHAYYPNKAGYKQFRVLLSLNILFMKDVVLPG